MLEETCVRTGTSHTTLPLGAAGTGQACSAALPGPGQMAWPELGINSDSATSRRVWVPSPSRPLMRDTVDILCSHPFVFPASLSCVSPMGWVLAPNRDADSRPLSSEDSDSSSGSRLTNHKSCKAVAATRTRYPMGSLRYVGESGRASWTRQHLS